MFQLRNHWFHFYDVETEILWGEIPEHDTELKRRISKNFFAREVSAFVDLFTKRLGMAVDKNLHTKVNQYAFTPFWAAEQLYQMPEIWTSSDVQAVLQ